MIIETFLTLFCISMDMLGGLFFVACLLKFVLKENFSFIAYSIVQTIILVGVADMLGCHPVGAEHDPFIKNIWFVIVTFLFGFFASKFISENFLKGASNLGFALGSIIAVMNLWLVGAFTAWILL